MGLLAACGVLPFLKAGPAAPTGVGVQVHLWGYPDTTQRDLELARAAGFTWVKQLFPWAFIEGDVQGRFEWVEPDRVVDAVDRAGLKLIVRLDMQPAWARADRIFPQVGPPDRMSDWGDFVYAVAKRYKGRIAAYEVWNEPNLAREWGERAPNAAEYVRLLQVAHQAVKLGDPDALVITGGLSPTTDLSDRARADIVYLQGDVRRRRKGKFDLLGVHAAGFKSPPEADPADVARSAELTNNDPSPEELRRTYSFRHVEDLRRVMEENGDGDRRIAILEMGWTSDPRPGLAVPLARRERGREGRVPGAGSRVRAQPLAALAGADDRLDVCRSGLEAGPGAGVLGDHEPRWLAPPRVRGAAPATQVARRSARRKEAPWS